MWHMCYRGLLQSFQAYFRLSVLKEARYPSFRNQRPMTGKIKGENSSKVYVQGGKGLKIDFSQCKFWQEHHTQPETINRDVINHSQRPSQYLTI